MDFKTALEFAEESFLAETKKSPTDLQKKIFEKAFEGKTYEKIAEECNCTDSYVKEVGSDLWRILSSKLGKRVSKKSFRNVFEEYDRSSSSATQPTTKLPEVETRCRQDWGEAPDVSIFYGRTEELTELRRWIVADKCRLVALFGMGGIGKTSLAVKLGKQIQNDFDRIIWRSLDRTPSLNIFLTEIIKFICNEQETNLPPTPSDPISLAIECLNLHRCLLIIDGIEAIMETGKLAGKYREGYQDYGKFFQKAAQLNHKSCVVFTSSEKPQEISLLATRIRQVRFYKIGGLTNEAAKQILLDRELVEEKEWHDFIERYEGNPLALWMISATVVNLFAGKTSDFLKTGTVFLGQVEGVLCEMFDRLTDVEVKVLCQLAVINQPISFSRLRDEISLDISSSVLMNVLESLSGRSLIETEVGQDLFRLQPVIRKYTIARFCQISS
ncbi:MAG: ATP-binding protein [Microcoleus sp. CSU_2_2]|nr:ATP-binding protein [Microcoleus sp. SU_5_3]NJS11739.1 ATP-binding protein [Microcoleus sp. CSU_2_2]